MPTPSARRVLSLGEFITPNQLGCFFGDIEDAQKQFPGKAVPIN